MWTLSFISEEDFTKHVKKTIEKYGEKLESFDLKRFNKNIIDPMFLTTAKRVAGMLFLRILMVFPYQMAA